ncbi:hypothetical protein HHI36_007272 [Cryptolaemus montrouzieri]|uniref:Thioredoxin domain-containing protein n=1 Tax=Cryptolaemus montrouzieri TaxID=559131 RepID=A0ABD2MPJ3_9CUCU
MSKLFFSNVRYYNNFRKLPHLTVPINYHSNNVRNAFNSAFRNYASKPKDMQKGEKSTGFSWKNLGITAVVGACLYGYMRYLKKEKDMVLAKERQKMLGKVAIGGKFELIDVNGKQRSSEEFLGQWLLIYFGFTHCPDVCPDELEKMSAVITEMDNSPEFPKIQPLFITVDPYRDTAEVIKKYCAEFHPRLLGLTGSEEQISKACKAYRVYFSAGPKDNDSDYIVDHTIIMYVVNPDGQFVDYYGQNRSAQEIAFSIKYNMEKHEQLKKTGWI